MTYSSCDVLVRIREMAVRRGCLLKDVWSGSGMGANTGSHMAKSMPKADNLALIADYLDCSVDYLLGRSESPYLAKTSDSVDAQPKTDEVSTEAETARQLLSELSEDKLAAVIAILKAIK